MWPPWAAIPGALAYYLNAVRNWSKKGVRFRTRVISTAASAGAFIVSLGDERVAEPGAKLIFHHARACNANDLTASAITELHSNLRRLDDSMLGILAARALAAPSNTPKVPFTAERSDREVLERLYAGLKPGTANKRLKRRKLARAIGRAVERACRDGDAETMKAIYWRLFKTEAPISAKLARTLRLIDRIGSRTAEDIRIEGTPGLTIPEWRVLYPPKGEIPREVLTRHVLVLGETGSGEDGLRHSPGRRGAREDASGAARWGAHHRPEAGARPGAREAGSRAPSSRRRGPGHRQSHVRPTLVSRRGPRGRALA